MTNASAINAISQNPVDVLFGRKKMRTEASVLEFKRTLHYDRVNPKGVLNPLSPTILQRIASCDSAAVQDCLDRYGGLVWSLAKRYIPNPQEAEDAVQEIFIELWKKAELFDENLASEKTFISMLTRRRLIDRLRRNYRRPNMESIETSFDLEAATLDSDQYVDGKKAIEAFSDLKPEQQKCLRLSIIAGMSHSEISEVVSLPIGTVKSHIRRGLIAVKDRIIGRGPNLATRRST